MYSREFEKFAATYKQTRVQALSGERPLSIVFWVCALLICPFYTVIAVLLQRFDANIILGHDFLGVTAASNGYHWSRISRFKRDAWITIGKQGTNIIPRTVFV